MKQDVTPELVAEALSFVNADDRETWICMGMAVHDALGDAGWPVWDEWSQTSPAYKAGAARSAWRGFRSGGGITIGSLLHAAKDCGWKPREAVENMAWRKPQKHRLQRKAEATDPIKARENERAIALIRAARFNQEPHPYLVNKGVGEHAVFRLRDSQNRLVIPMFAYGVGSNPSPYKLFPRSDQDRPNVQPRIQAVQLISEDGTKLFQPAGCKTGQTCVLIGSTFPNGGMRWVCEGVATGLSLYAALLSLGRDRDQVRVMFTAGNVRYATKGIVIADHDWWRCGARECRHMWDHEATTCPKCGGKRVTMPAGMKAAKQTRLRWWQPPDPGTDANDFHREHGTFELAQRLMALLNGRPMIGPAALPPPDQTTGSGEVGKSDAAQMVPWTDTL